MPLPSMMAGPIVEKLLKEAKMASLTIRNLDAPLKERLRLRAARNGHSMEREVRQILKTALNDEAAPKVHLADAIRALFEPMGGRS